MSVSSSSNNIAYNSPPKETVVARSASPETHSQPLIIGSFTKFVLSTLDTTNILDTHVCYQKNNIVVKKTTSKKKLIRSSKEEMIINDLVVVEDTQNPIATISASVAIVQAIEENHVLEMIRQFKHIKKDPEKW